MFSVDLFVESPIPFDQLFERSVIVSAFGTEVRICSLDDLIDMKAAVGRPQDLLDVAALTQLRNR